MRTVSAHLAAKYDDADIEVVIAPSADTGRGHYYLSDEAALTLAFDLIRSVIQGKRRQ